MTSLDSQLKGIADIVAPLNAAADEAKELFAIVQNALLDCRCGIRASVPLDDKHTLEFGRLIGGFQLFAQPKSPSDGSGLSLTVSSMSRAMTIAAAAKLPQLLSAIEGELTCSLRVGMGDFRPSQTALKFNVLAAT